MILRDLHAGPMRFGELQDGLPGLASNLLATRLEKATSVRSRRSSALESSPISSAKCRRLTSRNVLRMNWKVMGSPIALHASGLDRSLDEVAATIRARLRVPIDGAELA